MRACLAYRSFDKAKHTLQGEGNFAAQTSRLPAPPWSGPELESRTTDGIPLCFTQEQSLQKLEAIHEAHARGRAFLLVRGELSGKEQAAIISKALPEILRTPDLTKPPFIAKIYRDSSVKLAEF